ncbi:hypothetical protein AAF712_013155 [Marasmius tenuissimus]|uniref:Uncharacterized protein n=1 Tax=Marasmius tenuissimus TaxID=585030 RepID=A0ABR2ZFM2_9AGAR
MQRFLTAFPYNYGPVTMKQLSRNTPVVDGSNLDALSVVDPASAFHHTFRRPNDESSWSVVLTPYVEGMKLRSPTDVESWQLKFVGDADALITYDTIQGDRFKRSICIADDLSESVDRIIDDLIVKEEGYIDEALRSRLLGYNYNYKFSGSRNNREKAAEVILDAFKAARKQYPTLSGELLPTAFAARMLEEELEALLYTFYDPPQVTFTFTQNKRGEVWTNVKVVVPGYTSWPSRRRATNIVLPTANPRAVEEFRELRVGLEVVLEEDDVQYA